MVSGDGQNNRPGNGQQARERRGVYWESEVRNRKHRSPGVVVMSAAGEKCQAILSKVIKIEIEKSIKVREALEVK